MAKLFFGVFTDSVQVFGIIVSCLIIVVGFIVVLVVKNAIRKVKDLEQFHDDIVAVRLEMEGRKSFTDTIRRHDYEIMTLNRRNGELFDRVTRIDERCERRIEKEAYEGEDRRRNNA